MATLKWIVRRKRKGEALEPLTTKVSTPFLLALREYVEQVEQSQGVVMETLALRASPELRQLYRKHAVSSSKPSSRPDSGSITSPSTP
jgi:hypothetical protein